MAKGKYAAKRAGCFNAKSIALILVLVLAFGGVIGGTVAWLIAKSDPVVNTFTYGDIDIELDETDTEDDDNNPNTNEYEMMPGMEITKDPTVTVKAGSEHNWLFVKLEKSDNFDDFMTYTIAEGWTQLYDAQGNEVKGVYFRFQPETDVDVPHSVLMENQVIVKDDVTKQMLNELDENGASNYPTLTVTAYAVQYAGFEPEITEGAVGPDEAQVQAAAFNAWSKVLESESTEP